MNDQMHNCMRAKAECNSAPGHPWYLGGNSLTIPQTGMK